MEELIKKAGILIDALPYIQKFSVKTVAVGCERLLPETLAADSQFAYVLSDAGLGYYNFFSMEFKHRELGEHFTQGICGFICNGEYHAVIKAPQNVNKSIVFSFGNSNYHMSDTSVECDCLSVGGESVLVACKNVGYICCVGNGYISPAMKRIFSTPITNFGVADKKTLTAIWLYTNKTVLLSVCADGVTRLYKVTGGKGKRIIRPYISGEQFSFTIKAEGSGICISALGVEMEY